MEQDVLVKSDFKQYLVRYFAGALIDIESSRFVYNFENGVIYVNIHISDENFQIHNIWPSKLIIDVIIKETEIDNAIENSRYYAEATLSIISSYMSAAIDVVKFSSAIDISTGTKDRMFVHRHNLPGKMTIPRKMNTELFQEFYDKLGNADESIRLRLSRGFRFYRKGIQENEVFDKFFNYWTGLESINKLIIDKYGLPKEQIIRPCPSCGEPVITMPSNEGIKYLFTQKMGLESKTWGEIRKIRQNLIHGNETLIIVDEKAKRVLPILQQGLLLGLLDLLDIENKEYIRKEYSAISEPYFLFKALLSNVSYEILEKNPIPDIVIENCENIRINHREKAVDLEIKPKIRINGMSFTLLDMPLVLNKDPETNIENFEFQGRVE